MSTYVYLVCMDHEPPLVAEDESGQHLYDLPRIRADIRDRELLVAAAERDLVSDEYFRRNTVRFLRSHPTCRISIKDEYGVEHAVTEEGE